MSGVYNAPYNRPQLKDSCSSKLQMAFSDGQWVTVISLAKQSFKATKDSYYEALENAARSQLDTPADQIAAKFAVEKMIAEKTVLKDPYAIDLYDWACARVDKNYSKTIGALRARLVKAAPTSKDTAKTSFYACVANDDWENAQQIMASMDKNFPNEPRFLFSNILAYYVLSTKLSNSDVQRATMFQTLAKRLIEKARELRDRTPESADYPDRAISTEEEMRLWLDIQTHGAESEAEIFTRLKKPEFDALKHLSDGNVSVFKEIMGLLERHGAWDEIYRISQNVFEKGIEFMTQQKDDEIPKENPEELPGQEKTSEAAKAVNLKNTKEFTTTRADELTKAKKESEARAFCSAVMDWSLWNQFIGSARHHQEEEKALDYIRGFMSKVAQLNKIVPIYQKQMDLAELLILFGGPRSKLSVENGDTAGTFLTPRVTHLLTYAVSHYKHVSCFQDLKPYLEELSSREVKELLNRLSEECSKNTNDSFKNLMLSTLRLRFRYTFITSAKSLTVVPGTREVECQLCSSVFKEGPCKLCLESIAKLSVWTYNLGLRDRELWDHAKTQNVDPYSDITIIGATSLLKLAGLNSTWAASEPTFIQGADLRLVLQAISWLTAQYTNSPVKTQSIPVLLTKLYILIGCASHAQLIWDTLGVKNVTLDSLGPLFSDRLSSVAPGLWAQGKTTPMHNYTKHYMDSISRSIPNNTRNAFELGNYNSVLGMLKFQDQLRHSCTMVMAVVEDRRGTRAVGGKVAVDVRDDPLLHSIKDSDDLVVVTDYVSLPNHESAPRNLQDVISIGPGLSALRAKLSLVAEKFICLTSYREPKEFKPSKSGQIAETNRAYIAETCRQLRDGIHNQLKATDATAKLTSPEFAYYQTIYALISLVSFSLRVESPKSASRAAHVMDHGASLSRLLKEQTEALFSLRTGTTDTMAILGSFTSLHAMGMLRESVLVIKLSTSFLERTFSTFKSNVPKWVSDDLKKINAAASEAASIIKQRTKALNEAANKPGWLDKICEAAFGGLADGSIPVIDDPEDSKDGDLEMMVFNAVGQNAGLERVVGQMKDSWQDVAKGWSLVKLE